MHDLIDISKRLSLTPIIEEFEELRLYSTVRKARDDFELSQLKSQNSSSNVGKSELKFDRQVDLVEARLLQCK